MKKLFLIIPLLFTTLWRDIKGMDNPGRAEHQSSVCEALYKAHSEMLTHTDVSHKPLVICFSGTPGMGKTYLAKLLQEKYNGVRLCTDEIRDLIKTSCPSVSNGELLLGRYLFYFLEHYKGPNKLIILDASIDRRYAVLFPLLEQKKIPYVVIRFDVPRDVVIDRIKQRDGPRNENYLQLLDFWYADYEAFGRGFPRSFILKNGSDGFLQNSKELDAFLKPFIG